MNLFAIYEVTRLLFRPLLFCTVTFTVGRQTDMLFALLIVVALLACWLFSQRALVTRRYHSSVGFDGKQAQLWKLSDSCQFLASDSPHLLESVWQLSPPREPEPVGIRAMADVVPQSQLRLAAPLPLSPHLHHRAPLTTIQVSYQSLENRILGSVDRLSSPSTRFVLGSLEMLSPSLAAASRYDYKERQHPCFNKYFSFRS